jgi:hypothetical protein
VPRQQVHQENAGGTLSNPLQVVDQQVDGNRVIVGKIVLPPMQPDDLLQCLV